MLERGFAVRLLTDEGSAAPGGDTDGFPGSIHDSAESAGLMMDTLAVVGHSDGGGLSRAHDVLRGGDEGLLVAFFGDLDEEQAAVAARMRQRSRGAVAFVLDSGDWTRGGESVAPAPASERLRLLREAGWTALAVPPGAELARLWQQAGQEDPGVRSSAAGTTTGFPGGRS
ncbi:hypothetical protein EAO68_30570 [Streptomyces sp. wa22]|nr:hypothetical protein EAO68_30570 [Streptomyces sp. wa22]